MSAGSDVVLVRNEYWTARSISGSCRGCR